MAWKQISECLPAWLSAKIDKGTGADEGPGQVVVREEQRQVEEMPDGTSRERMNAALPMGRKQRIAPGRPIPVVASPKPAVRCFLVIEGGGGRPAGSGGLSRAAYAQAREERGRNPASNSLRLVR